MLLVLLCGWGLNASAQNDVVKLQDGSVIRGTIIEYIVGDHVRIKTEEGKVFEYPSAQVSRTSVGGKLNNTVKAKGYYNISSLGLALGSREYSGLSVSPGIYTVNGWKFNKHLMAGVGVGLEWLNESGKMPIFLDARYRILQGNVSPFVGVMAGYNVSLQGKDNRQYYDIWYDPGRHDKGGVTAGIQFGFLANVGEHIGLTGSAGYRYQHLTTSYNDYWWNNGEYNILPVIERTDMHRVTLSFGLLFE